MKIAMICLPLILLLAVTVACGGGDDDDDGPGAAATSGGSSPTQAGGGSGGGGGGEARLTVGDQTWEFENYRCAFGHGATQSDVYSFSSTDTIEVDGARLELFFDIRDEDGEGRYEGDGVFHELRLTDVTDRGDSKRIATAVNFSGNEFFLYRMFNELPEDEPLLDPLTVRIDGDRVTAEGWFREGGEFSVVDHERPLEEQFVRGSFEATCGPGSRR